LRELLRHARSDASVSAVLALTIFAFAAGSSSLIPTLHAGERSRWLLLGLLAILAAWSAFLHAPRPVVLPITTVLAGALMILAVGSTLWSADPTLTFHRASSLVLLLLTAALLAQGTGGVRERIEPLLWGILAAAVAVGLISVLVGIADPGAAGSVSHRFRGFGQQATTDAMLYAPALPIALFAVLRARTRRQLALALGAFVLIDVLLILTGSRGPEIGGMLALVVVGLATPGRRLAIGGAVVATIALALVIGLVQTSNEPGQPAVTQPAVAKPTTHAKPAANPYPSPGILSQELGSRANGLRSLFKSSGRTGAWRGAVEKADQRPALGWGFGTEDHVFENHYFGYQGDFVSSSWIGFYLQLGAVGAALLLATWVVLGIAVVRVLRVERDPAAVTCAAIVAAGFPITFVESWIYSAGNVASLPFWIGALVLGMIVWGRLPAPEPTSTRLPLKEADAVAA
jgi:O-antigen ligase